MRFVLDERELSNVRKIVMAVVRRNAWEHRNLFLSDRDYREWTEGVTDEAIGRALVADDYNPDLGGLAKFVYLKTEPIIRRDLREERRYRGRVLDMVRERPPEYDDPFTRLIETRDLEAAMLKLSDDHRQVIALVYFAEVSKDDAGRIMKRSRDTLNRLLSRARHALAEVLVEPSLLEPQGLESAVYPPKRPRGRPRSNLSSKSQDEPPGFPLLKSVPLTDSSHMRRQG